MLKEFGRVLLQTPSGDKSADAELFKRLVLFLDDRRVLYNPYEAEVPEMVHGSIQSIRGFLGELRFTAREDGFLKRSLDDLQAACRAFLDAFERDPVTVEDMREGRGKSWKFIADLGVLRGVFAAHLELLSGYFGFELTANLSSLIVRHSGKEASSHA